jgi:hypothetical protein
MMRDVTKTKPSHHRQPNKIEAAAKQQWPSTPTGGQLATLVRDYAGFTADVKARLTMEIIDHEANHGLCTQTFARKIKKQMR